MKAPEFWLTRGPLSRLLEPVGALISVAGWLRRQIVKPWVAPVPVICIGNITVGGTGKTPVALWLGRHLKSKGHHPAYLSRGYGGALNGPLQVSRESHTALQVGDEPLLLAGVAPTWIGSDRVATAKAAIAAGADCLIMDDGFQNPGLAKTCSFVVVDGGIGFGNGKLIPAGPCRELPRYGLQRADALIVIGEDKRNVAANYAAILPVAKASFVPRDASGGDVKRWQGQRVIAFAGIGRPSKFFKTLEELGAHILNRHPFADHHPYKEDDIQPILDEAFSLRAIPVTTEKDAMRLPLDQRQQVDVVGIDLQWDGNSDITPYIASCFANADQPSTEA